MGSDNHRGYFHAIVGVPHRSQIFDTTCNGDLRGVIHHQHVRILCQCAAYTERHGVKGTKNRQHGITFCGSCVYWAKSGCTTQTNKEQPKNTSATTTEKLTESQHESHNMKQITPQRLIVRWSWIRSRNLSSNMAEETTIVTCHTCKSFSSCQLMTLNLSHPYLFIPVLGSGIWQVWTHYCISRFSKNVRFPLAISWSIPLPTSLPTAICHKLARVLTKICKEHFTTVMEDHEHI